MNAEKLTQKSLEALQEANDTAVRYRSSSIGQLHLLYALLAQDGGFIPQVFKKMTVEPADLLSAVKAKLDAEPKVSGQTQMYMSTSLNEALIAAEDAADKMKDE